MKPGKKFTPNEYIFEEDTVVIVLNHGWFAFVDVEDFPKVRHYRWALQVGSSKGRKTYYVFANLPRDHYERGRLLLHRFLLNAPDGMDVDHKDGCGMNNRRGNIRLATRSQNMQNRSRGADKDHKSTGVRNVYLHRATGMLRVQICVDKKTKHYGTFPNTSEGLVSATERALEVRGQIHTFGDGR